MSNKQLGRKFAVENTNATAAREAIALVEGLPVTKLANASDAEVIELFETLSRNMKDEVVSEMVENYEQALEATKNNFLLRVNNQINIIIETDYKILSESFLVKIQQELVKLLGSEAYCRTKFLKHRMSKLIDFKKDEWNNYDFTTENSSGIIKGSTVQFMSI